MTGAIKTMVTIGNCTLYHGDIREVLPRLISEGMQADMICSDPPYLLTAGGPNGVMQGKFNKLNYDNGGHLVPCDIDWPEFMELFFKAMGRGHAYVMANNRNVQDMLNAAEAAGFGFHNLLTWDKITATPNRWYMKNIEFTGLFYKGKAIMINDCGSKAGITLTLGQPDTNHPTEKPVSLMEYYILNSTQPGDLVLDPFAGSGTTGVAAARIGRKFIGIEKDKNWFDVMVKRIEKASINVQERLF